ncbi:ribosomal RNA small subunit methyltransferase H-like isoform X2 [Watersipora subatra]
MKHLHRFCCSVQRCNSVAARVARSLCNHTQASGSLSGSGNVELDHIPVLKQEVVSLLQPSPGKTFIDMTFGSGGHSAALLEECPDIHIIGLDRDPIAKTYAKKIQRSYQSDVEVWEGTFTEMPELLAEHGQRLTNFADGIIFDVGASSMQFQDRRRGFGLKSKGPLDMRMGRKSNLTAADVLNKLDEKDLQRVLKRYGQEKRARQIARAVVEHRQMMGPILTTRELQDIVSDVYSQEDIANPQDSLGRKQHPATLTFQALRIFVNDELNQLYNGLKIAHLLLKPKGVCVVVSFHSLEHNIAHQVFNTKHALRMETLLTPDIMHCQLFPWHCNRTVTKPSTEEIHDNPRSRSAELRYAYKRSVIY